MSTIAYDGKMLAFDTLMVDGSRRDLEPVMKMVLVKEGAYCYAGGVGEYGIVHLFQRWIRDGGDFPELCSKEGRKNCYFVAIHSNGELHEFESTEYPILKTRNHFAVGSGGGFALGAMLHGATALEAVNIAVSVDVFTGGKVIHVKVPVDPRVASIGARHGS